VEIDDGFVFDYRLTCAPRITRQFIETSHKVSQCRNRSTQRSVVACIIKLYVRYVVACRDMVRKAAYVERNLAQVEMLHGS